MRYESVHIFDDLDLDLHQATVTQRLLILLDARMYDAAEGWAVAR